MKPMIVPALFAALLAGGPALAQDAGSQTTAEPTEGEVKLAKLIGEREAGNPQSCIPAYGLRSMTIIDGTALVFDYGRTIYVNIPQRPDGLSDRDRLVTQRSMSRMCSGDLVQTEDRLDSFYTGNINLNQFVPYKPASSTDAG